MRRTVVEDFVDDDGAPYFTVKIIDDTTGRTIRRMDGSERWADSRYSKNPHTAVEMPTSGAIRYRAKGIV